MHGLSGMVWPSVDRIIFRQGKKITPVYSVKSLNKIFQAIKSMGDTRFGPHAPVGYRRRSKNPAAVWQAWHRKGASPGLAPERRLRTMLAGMRLRGRSQGTGLALMQMRHEGSVGILKLKDLPALVLAHAPMVPVHGANATGPAGIGNSVAQSTTPSLIVPRNHDLETTFRVVKRPLGLPEKPVAPVRLNRRGIGISQPSPTLPPHARRPDEMAEPAQQAGTTTPNQMHDLARALETYFARAARLPPSGASAFDPRLTPAWAGLKIPV